MSDHEPGTYVKGDKTRYATTASEAVAAVFDGYTKQGEIPLVVEQALSEDGAESTPEYRTLQERAKKLGIPAVGSKEALAQAVAAKEAEGA